MDGFAPKILPETIGKLLGSRSSGVEKKIGHVQDNGIALFLSKTPDEEVKEYINSTKMAPGDIPTDPVRLDVLQKHINDEYKKYTIDPKLKDYESLYVHRSLINEGDGTIKLDEAKSRLGCYEIDKQENEKVEMSEKANCSLSGGRKSRKQRRSKRRRRRGRQSRK
jgi:hypothetical protein